MCVGRTFNPATGVAQSASALSSQVLGISDFQFCAEAKGYPSSIQATRFRLEKHPQRPWSTGQPPLKRAQYSTQMNGSQRPSEAGAAVLVVRTKINGQTTLKPDLLFEVVDQRSADPLVTQVPAHDQRVQFPNAAPISRVTADPAGWSPRVLQC